MSRRIEATIPDVSAPALRALYDSLVAEFGLTPLGLPAVRSDGPHKSAWLPFKQGFITLCCYNQRVSVVAEFRKEPQNRALFERRITEILGLSNHIMICDERAVDLDDDE